MKRSRFLRIATLCGLLVPTTMLGACQEESQLTVEVLPEVQPNLPAVPTLPPPPHPTTYEDGSYSIYGLRSRLRNTIDTEVDVTGFIVDIYTPPECTRQPCPRPAAPHMWIADTANETERSKQLMIVGYAENQESIDEAVELASRGRYEPPDPESGILPIPTDFAAGNKVKIHGRFARIGSSGFNNSEGLLEYLSHETLVDVNAEAE